jgi:hypothetical protein
MARVRNQFYHHGLGNTVFRQQILLDKHFSRLYYIGVVYIKMIGIERETDEHKGRRTGIGEEIG